MNETWKGMKYAEGQCSVLLGMLFAQHNRLLPTAWPRSLPFLTTLVYPLHQPDLLPSHSSSIPVSRSDTTSFPIPRPSSPVSTDTVHKHMGISIYILGCFRGVRGRPM